MKFKCQFSWHPNWKPGFLGSGKLTNEGRRTQAKSGGNKRTDYCEKLVNFFKNWMCIYIYMYRADLH